MASQEQDMSPKKVGDTVIWIPNVHGDKESDCLKAGFVYKVTISNNNGSGIGFSSCPTGNTECDCINNNKWNAYRFRIHVEITPEDLAKAVPLDSVDLNQADRFF